MFLFLIFSCVQDGDFEAPNVEVKEPDVTVNSDISAVKSALIQEFLSSGDLTYTFFDDEDAATPPTIIEGYVVSSDAAGNFFKTLIIQDKPENPTAGIEITLNNSNFSSTFEVGRKVYVKLDGLTVSYDDGESDDFINPTNDVPGKYVLGVLDGNSLVDIPSTAIKNHIFRSSSVEEIIPTKVSVTICGQVITDNNINTLVKLESAQFASTELGKTFAGESIDEFDGFRALYECETAGQLFLQTSTFTSFKSNIIPDGNGEITFVLSKDFRSEFLVAILNKPSDINFINTSRCGVTELNCGLTSQKGPNSIFSDDFETQIRNSPITGNGWTNFIQEGSVTWEAFTSSSSNSSLGVSARIGSNGSNDKCSISWLITPVIDLNANNGVTIKFQTSNSFADNSKMELLYSVDWDGTENGIESATWITVSAAYITKDSDSFTTWFDSGLIDLSCGSKENSYFAFKYTGSGSSAFDGTYELDNIEINAN